MGRKRFRAERPFPSFEEIFGSCKVYGKYFNYIGENVSILSGGGAMKQCRGSNTTQKVPNFERFQ